MSDALLTTAASTTTGSVCCNARIPPYIKQVRLAALILSDSRKTARAIYVNQQFSQRALPAGELTIASSVSAACGLSLSLSLSRSVCVSVCLFTRAQACQPLQAHLPSQHTTQASIPKAAHKYFIMPPRKHSHHLMPDTIIYCQMAKEMPKKLPESH